ncbi:MAG: hypothetical protein H7829_11005 [Magnetococcus sp. THC-1_WYH]
MKSRILAIAAGAFVAVGFAASAQACPAHAQGCPLHAGMFHHGGYAYPGTWRADGWVQWHNLPGYTQLGSVGTQRYMSNGGRGFLPYPYFYNFVSPLKPTTALEVANPELMARCVCHKNSAASGHCACPAGACKCAHHHQGKDEKK